MVIINENLLWIAFKIYYLRDRSQQVFNTWLTRCSCELLSKFIIFVTGHNSVGIFSFYAGVVNCFQNLLSSWQVTTMVLCQWYHFSLWIAFKIYYLRDRSQHTNYTEGACNCCELLSKFIIFVTGHNFLIFYFLCFFVVNCFQNLLSSWQVTTNLPMWWYLRLLWIAFKIYYLRDRSQQIYYKSWNGRSCELLSKFIIFVTGHNRRFFEYRSRFVVNCFQNLLSSWQVTTCFCKFTHLISLWIAFKIYYLRDRSQLREINLHKKISCELLSKFIIFVTGHNDNRIQL